MKNAKAKAQPLLPALSDSILEAHEDGTVWYEGIAVGETEEVGAVPTVAASRLNANLPQWRTLDDKAAKQALRGLGENLADVIGSKLTIDTTKDGTYCVNVESKVRTVNASNGAEADIKLAVLGEELDTSKMIARCYFRLIGQVGVYVKVDVPAKVHSVWLVDLHKVHDNHLLEMKLAGVRRRFGRKIGQKTWTEVELPK